LRVLVVEDDADLAEYARLVLSRRGDLDITVVADGHQALDHVRRHDLDLLVTDIQLPGVSGLDIAAAARARDATLPIAVMTAHASLDYALTALRSQVDEFLVKPVKPAEWPVADAAPAPSLNPARGTDGSRGTGDGISVHELADARRDALAGSPACLVRLPLGWHGADLQASHPLDYLGMDGGAGIGSGPGMAVGAALALEGSGRLAVAVLGDGDFLMGGTAVWTAARYRLPLLIVVANNSSFHTDVVHA